MFTGIVTDVGTVRSAEQRGDLRLQIQTGYDLDSVDLGASIACSGVCLTVVDKGEDWFAVDVSAETGSRNAGAFDSCSSTCLCCVSCFLSRPSPSRYPRPISGAKAPGSTWNARFVWATNSGAISSPGMGMR